MSDGEPADTLRERVDGRPTRLWLWVLLDAGRLRLTAALCAGFFAAVVVGSAVAVPSLREVMASGSDPVETLCQALVTGLITGVTLVVTISQLVLSQETGPLGDQRQRMEGALGFREDAEKFLDGVSPPEPSSFLRALVEVSRDRAARLRDAAADDPGSDDLREFLDRLVAHAEEIRDRLDDAEFGRYEVVRAALDYNYSWKIYRARQLHRAHADDLDDDATSAFDDLLEVLQFFGPAREHVKTLYFQWELVALSRQIFYLAVPALVVSTVALLFLEPTSFPGRSLGVDDLTWVVAGTATVGVAPFLLLGAYVVRLATIARRTLAIGPFVLRETDRGGGGERDG